MPKKLLKINIFYKSLGFVVVNSEIKFEIDKLFSLVTSVFSRLCFLSLIEFLQMHAKTATRKI